MLVVVVVVVLMVMVGVVVVGVLEDPLNLLVKKNEGHFIIKDSPRILFFVLRKFLLNFYTGKKP